MKIGNVELEGKVILAPMAGVCNSAYRKICKEMGAALVCCEMVSDKGMVYNSKKTKDMLYFEEVERLLKGMGFTGIIQLEPVKKGWLNKEGNVKSVSIDGLTKFEVDTIFEKNATIIITYYSSDAE